MTDAKVEVDPFLASELVKSDKELSEDVAFLELYKKYSQVASDETVAATVKALEAKGHKASVVENGEELIKLVDGMLKEGSGVWCGASQTLRETGFHDWLKAKEGLADYKSQYLAALGSNDYAAAGAAQAKSWSADFWFASVGAVAETGEFNWGSLTGSRVSLSAKNLVLVVGTNKITATAEEAMKRLTEYQKRLEDARSRIVYKVPASTLSEIAVVNSANPYNKNIHVIFVKGSFGF